MTGPRLRVAPFCLVFGCIILASCTHSPRAETATSTVVIPASSAHSPTHDPEPTAPPPPAMKPGTPSNANECGIPADWTGMDTHFDMPVDESVVLDWRQLADGRPIIIDEAILWTRGHQGTGKYWYLTMLYRHPKERNEWRLAIVYDSPVEPQKFYEHAPNTVDVDAFLKNTTWNNRDDSFKQTGGRRCNAAWSHVVDAPL